MFYIVCGVVVAIALLYSITDHSAKPDYIDEEKQRTIRRAQKQNVSNDSAQEENFKQLPNNGNILREVKSKSLDPEKGIQIDGKGNKYKVVDMRSAEEIEREKREQAMDEKVMANPADTSEEPQDFVVEVVDFEKIKQQMSEDFWEAVNKRAVDRMRHDNFRKKVGKELKKKHYNSNRRRR